MHFSIQAQAAGGSGMITGKIVDKNTKQPVALANVKVLQPNDSSFVTGQTSKNDGSFSLPVKYGTYIVNISFLGYTDIFRNVQVTPTRPIARLDTLYFEQKELVLSEVVVTEKAPEVRVKGDTLEFNAGSFKVMESAVVEDLLKKMPGVEIDKDGKIMVNGREIKKIMVDGKNFSARPQSSSKIFRPKWRKKFKCWIKNPRWQK
jgi:hypothetical protein